MEDDAHQAHEETAPVQRDSVAATLSSGTIVRVISSDGQSKI